MVKLNKILKNRLGPLNILKSYKSLAVLAIILLIAFVAYAKNETRMIVYDLGKISYKKVMHYKYEFKEEIKNAMSLCECVKVKVYKKYESQINPLSIVDVEIDPREYNGKFSQDISLLDKDDNFITLRLNAFVE